MATSRIAIDCRWFPANIPCEFVISGDEEQVLNLAVQHAVESHGYRDTPALREQLRSILRNESKRAAVPEAASDAQ